MKIETFEEAVTHFNYLHKHPRLETDYIIHNDTLVYYSSLYEDVNLFYCKENNIPTYRLTWPGGSIVAGSGDLTYIHLSKRDNPDHFNLKWKKFLTGKMAQLGVQLIEDNNDLLLPKGFKFCGMMGKDIGDYFLEAGHISINPNLDQIIHICMKPMVKIPAGLGQYGVTSEMLEQWFNEFYFQTKGAN